MPTSELLIALEQDLIEIRKLLDIAVRKRAKDVLTAEIVKLNAEINAVTLKRVLRNF